jgi:hypothetical protein
MNWLQKLLCDHQWKKVCTHASLSMFDQSGFIEHVEECDLCHKSRGRTITLASDGRVEKVNIR